MVLVEFDVQTSWQYILQFLDLFGDTQTIKKADNRHAKLFLPHKNALESKKRHMDGYLVSDRAKLAKTGGVSPAPSAYPGTQNQWPAGYGVQTQAWPQATQAQGQQWPATYTQQAAYGAYNAYGTTYAQPQAPTAAPQAAAATTTAAYAAYPASYPVQGAPQQVYAQPDAAVAATAVAPPPSLTPAQQPTAAVAPQSYYGTYY